jgi:SAM-dependent methyltransferase
MNAFIQNYVKEVKQKIGKQGRVLEIGSRNFNGGVRQYFKDADKYIGIDAHKGKGVDRMMLSYDIPKHYKKESFDCVICLETLEHDPYFWATLKVMQDVLKPKGWLIISTPCLFQDVHEIPQDYYRFMPDTYKNIFFNGYSNGQISVCFGKGYEPKRKIDYRQVATIIGYGQKPKN